MGTRTFAFSTLLGQIYEAIPHIDFPVSVDDTARLLLKAFQAGPMVAGRRLGPRTERNITGLKLEKYMYHAYFIRDVWPDGAGKIWISVGDPWEDTVHTRELRRERAYYKSLNGHGHSTDGNGLAKMAVEDYLSTFESTAMPKPETGFTRARWNSYSPVEWDTAAEHYRKWRALTKEASKRKRLGQATAQRLERRERGKLPSTRELKRASGSGKIRYQRK